MAARRHGLLFACLLLAGLVPGQGAGEPMGPGPGRIVATYDADLAGLKLGEFQVTAKFAGDGYEMAAEGRFSLLAGLIYKATGRTTSRGIFTQAAPQPARYAFSFDDSKKRVQVRMKFARGAVSDISIVPRKTHARDIPVTAEQLENVLDPLTASFLSVRSDAPPGDLEVCRQTIRVFDGRQRFDIVLSPKRSVRLDGRLAKAFSGRAAVCRVRYQPISGYRPDHPGVQYMRKNDKVEVWLVPVPRAGLYIPYKVLMPTAWGTGTLDLTGIKASLGAQRAGVP